MGYRFLIVNTDYDEFLSWLYAEHPGLDNRPYDEQMRLRMETLFGVADFYSSNLRELGHEAWNVIANNEFVQKAWAREHGLAVDSRTRLHRGAGRAFESARRLAARAAPRLLKALLRPLVRTLDDRQPWLYNILSSQIEYYRPDVLLNQNVGLSSKFFDEMKPYTRLLVGQHASPVPQGQDLSAYDLMISSLPNLVDYFRQGGIPCQLHRLGFEPTVLQKLGEVKNPTGVSFVGSLFPAHTSRRRWLEYVSQRIPLEVWGHGTRSLPPGSPIIRRYRGTAWGREMYRILRASRVTLNHHIDVAENYANNMRLFEATGVGTLLITDWKENLREMFETGSEVVAYRSPEECVELIQHYLHDDDEREGIARRGQERTLREHTYRDRMQELVEIVGKLL